MLAHVTGSTGAKAAPIRGRPVFQAAARRNLSDEKRVSRISSGDFHGARKIHCIRLIGESPFGQYSFLRLDLSHARALGLRTHRRFNSETTK